MSYSFVYSLIYFQIYSHHFVETEYQLFAYSLSFMNLTRLKISCIVCAEYLCLKLYLKLHLLRDFLRQR